MKKSSPPLLILFSFILLHYFVLCGCKNEIKEDQSIPLPLRDTVAFNITPSTFNIPVTYSISALETYLNEKIKGDFLETIIHPEDRKNLVIYLKLTKTGDIKLSSNRKVMTCFVPVKAVATVENSNLNILTKGLKPVETELTIELETPASLDTNWNLVTKFKLVKINWTKSPKLKVLGINFDLQNSIDKFLAEDKEMLTALLDEEINRGVSLAKPIGDVWYDLQSPILVSKEEPYVYLKFICEGIAGKFILGDTSITCITSIKALVGLITDTTGGAAVRKKLPAFMNNYIGDSLSVIHMHLIAGFNEMNKELSTHLVGNTFTAGGMSLTIKGISVYGSELGMIIRLKATGAVNGEMIATATPYFDSTKQHLGFKEFDFKVVSNNALLNIADVLLHNMIRDSIQAGLGLELNTVLSDIPGIIHKALSKGKVGQTIDIHVSDMKISTCRLVLDAEHIHLNIHTYFFAGITLKHINPGSPLRIRPKNKSADQTRRK